MEKIETEHSSVLIDMTLKTQKFVDKDHLQEIKNTDASYQQEWAEYILTNYNNFKDELPYAIHK